MAKRVGRACIVPLAQRNESENRRLRPRGRGLDYSLLRIRNVAGGRRRKNRVGRRRYVVGARRVVEPEPFRCDSEERLVSGGSGYHVPTRVDIERRADPSGVRHRLLQRRTNDAGQFRSGSRSIDCFGSDLLRQPPDRQRRFRIQRRPVCGGDARHQRSGKRPEHHRPLGDCGPAGIAAHRADPVDHSAAWRRYPQQRCGRAVQRGSHQSRIHQTSAPDRLLPGDRAATARHELDGHAHLHRRRAPDGQWRRILVRQRSVPAWGRPRHSHDR